MKYIKDYKEGDRISEIYLCKHKQSAVTKNGKAYDSIVLQDRTGTIDGKIWDPNSAGIGEFGSLDYIEVFGEVTSFQGALQVTIKRVRLCHEGEYDPSDYLPVSEKNIDEMYAELLTFIDSIENEYLKELLNGFFRKDESFASMFRQSSAAKTVHHGFVGGLLEHTLGVTKLCEYYSKTYPILNRDLLLTAAMCHDIGKTREISRFPENDYTDEGQLLGHIVMGSEMVGELKHCILSHHGEYEFGSPKKPALAEAVALNFADNTDAKLQTFTEILKGAKGNDWLGYNRLFESNVRKTRMK